MGSDDDTIIIRGGKKIVAALNAPVSNGSRLRWWHLALTHLAAFVGGFLL